RRPGRGLLGPRCPALRRGFASCGPPRAFRSVPGGPRPTVHRVGPWPAGTAPIDASALTPITTVGDRRCTYQGCFFPVDNGGGAAHMCAAPPVLCQVEAVERSAPRSGSWVIHFRGWSAAAPGRTW